MYALIAESCGGGFSASRRNPKRQSETKRNPNKRLREQMNDRTERVSTPEAAVNKDSHYSTHVHTHTHNKKNTGFVVLGNGSVGFLAARSFVGRSPSRAAAAPPGVPRFFQASWDPSSVQEVLGLPLSNAAILPPCHWGES